MDNFFLTRDQLRRINQSHCLELKKIKKMNEAQFQTFKKNFSVGCLEEISKREAEELLASMCMLNLKLQEELPEK